MNTEKSRDSKPTIQPLLRFNDYKIVNVIFKIDEKDTTENDLEVVLNSSPIFHNEKDFSLNFVLKVSNEINTVNIEVNAIANFSSSEIINEEYKNSNLVKSNAPAIFFPYLRAFISTLSINCGANPIILPTFNFTTKSADK